jgi:hypothetical protein
LPIFSRVVDLKEFAAPWGRTIRLQEVEIAGGLVMLRVRIQEGRRFTDLELGRPEAEHLGRLLRDWAAETPEADMG